MQDFESLRRKWQDAEWQVRASLAIEIGKLGTPEAENFLCAAINDKDETYFVRGFAALSLSRAKRNETIGLLSQKLNKDAIFNCDSSEFVRACCAQALGENAEFVIRVEREAKEGALAALRAALEDEPTVVEKAIPALGRLGDRQSLGNMYRASKSKLINLKGEVDFGPLAMALADMGITEPPALMIYRNVLEMSEEMETAEKLMEKVEALLREDASVDSDGALSSSLRVCKRKMELSRLAKSTGDSVVDSVLGRISSPVFRESKVPPPLPGQKTPAKLKLTPKPQ